MVLGFLLGIAFLFSNNVRVTEAQPNGINGNNHQEVCFCHNVNQNPHTICTDDQGEIRGHRRHVRNGQDTFGECERPTPTPTEEPEFHYLCRENSCVAVEGEGESNCKYDEDCLPEVTPTPTQEPCRDLGYGCGGSPSFDPPKYSAPVCTVEVPKQASNPQYHKSNGAVKITWEHDGTNLSKWSLNYGYDKDNMFMGIPYIEKDAREVTLNGLQNKTTWVAICAYNGDSCQSCTVFDP